MLKTIYYTQKYLLNSFIVYHITLRKFFQESPWAALHFCSHKYESCPLSKQQDTYAFPGSPRDLPWCISVAEQQKIPLYRKARLEFLGKSVNPVFNWEKKPTFRPKITCL